MMLVEETFVEETLVAAKLVDETDARDDWPVTVSVPMFKLPEPVALVKV